MARKAREVIPGQAMHIVARGRAISPIFLSDELKLSSLAWLRDASKDYELAVHAYCILANRVELLATPKYEQSLARTMQSFGRRYTQLFNQLHGQTGTIWQDRYVSKIIQADLDLLETQARIEFAAVSEGLVTHPKEYRWSSYRIHIGEDPNYGLTDARAFWALGNTPFERQRAWELRLGQGI